MSGSPTSPGPSTGGVLVRIFLVLIFGALLWVLADVVLLLFAAILLAVFLRAAATALAKVTRLPVGLCLGAVVILAVLFTGGFAWLVGPRFVREGQQLVTEIYAYAGQLRQRYAGSFWVQALEGATGHGLPLAPLAPKLLTVTFGTMGGLFLLIVTALYLAAAPRLYLRGAILLLPPERRQRGAEIFALVGHALRYWMLGQLIDMAFVGVLATLGLVLLGIPLPVALGVLAGLFTFIPYLGAILAGIPAVIVASTVSPAAILWVVLLYTACHVLEGYIVSPLISRRTVHLPPAVTVLSMSILGELYGFMGVLIATPLTAAIILLVKEIYVRDFLHTADDEPEEAEPRRFNPWRRPQAGRPR